MHLLMHVSPPADGSWVNFAGNAVYPEERERILGQKAKRTRRLAERAARRSKVSSLSESCCTQQSVGCFKAMCQHTRVSEASVWTPVPVI